jgi:outer membrane protein, heavy metal efflux system
MPRENLSGRTRLALMRVALCAAASLVLVARGALAQDAAPSQKQADTQLSELLHEAEHNNPRIQAALHGWHAAQQVPTQVSTLPDPQFQLQQVSVGSPRPFAGYTNSDFAYVGLGVSQDLPYPGKLHLRGEIAQRDADVLQQQFESVRRSVLAEVKTDYFRLAYLSKTLGLIQSDGLLLEEVEKAAEARYRSGVGTQQDLLAAQLEQTKLLREINMHHLDMAQAQARMKEALNRSQAGPGVIPGDLSEAPLPYSFEDVLSAAKEHNPDIAGAEKMIARQKLQVNLAKKDFYPDFNLQYAWERTDPSQYRAYYVLTFGVRVPIYHSRKQKPELAQAEAALESSRSQYDVQTQQVAAELRNAYDTAQKTAELLAIYREGLQPQSRAEFRAGLAAYQNNRQEFQAVLTAFRDLLQLDKEYWQSVAEHETALARLEELTGLALHQEGESR